MSAEVGRAGARLACVDLPALPLQILKKRHPEWRLEPVAVVDEDKPQGRVLWVDERARASRVLPGMRYASALSLEPKLRAGVVSRETIARTVDDIARRLRRYTPNVEPGSASEASASTDAEAGVLWLDASGFERLWPSLSTWSRRVRDTLDAARWHATVVVGFTRFGTYALARGKRGRFVSKSVEEERRLARDVPLDRLTLDPRARDALAKLGITRVGPFVDLPTAGIARRFGPELARLHRLANGTLDVPMQPRHPVPPAVERFEVEDRPVTAVPALVAIVERSVEPLLATLRKRGEALARLELGLRFERLGQHVESIVPAAPTLDARQLVDLVRLRLDALRDLPDGVQQVVLLADAVPSTARQRELFDEGRRRDRAAGERALARVRARLGDEAVVRARLRDGHLPEATFRWEKARELPKPEPRTVDTPHAIRRVFAKPVPLPPRPRHEPDGWMLHGFERGPVTRVAGPYVVSGGWWRRTVHREYHYAETKHGELLWIFWNPHRRRWYLHGRLE